MSIESELFDTLKGLVANRVYPLTFLRAGGVPPVWPAIRYSLISNVPAIALCGDSGDDAVDVRVQIDCVALTYSEMRSLRLQIMNALVAFPIPAIHQDSFESYDQETKTYRSQLDYVIYKSSGMVV